MKAEEYIINVPHEIIANSRAAIVRVEATPGRRWSKTRFGTAAFFSPRHLLTSYDIVKGGNNIILRGRALPSSLNAELVASVPDNHLALLRVCDGEPEAKQFLQLAPTFPTRITACYHIGYTVRAKQWRRTLSAGAISPKLENCPCSSPRCPFRHEDKGWARAIIELSNPEDWCGGLIFNELGQALTLIVRSQGQLKNNPQLAMMIGSNPSRMRDLLEQAHC